MNKINTTSYEYLVNENRLLVYKIARRFKCSYLEFDDLVQIGFMGLLKAIHHFDINKNVKFSTFATYYIIGAIKDELRKVTKDYQLNSHNKIIFKENFDDIPFKYLNLLAYDFTSFERLIIKLRLSGGLTQAEIAKRLNVSQSKISRAFKAIKEKIEIKKIS